MMSIGALVELAEHRRTESIPFLPSEDFDDVRDTLVRLDTLPEPIGGEPRPGWRVPA
jgi:hypothetical protein